MISHWEHLENHHWRCFLLGYVLDIARLGKGQWGWTVCLNDHLIDAGLAKSPEQAKKTAVSVCQTTLAGEVAA